MSTRGVRTQVRPHTLARAPACVTCGPPALTCPGTAAATGSPDCWPTGLVCECKADRSMPIRSEGNTPQYCMAMVTRPLTSMSAGACWLPSREGMRDDVPCACRARMCEHPSLPVHDSCIDRQARCIASAPSQRRLDTRLSSMAGAQPVLSTWIVPSAERCPADVGPGL